jgi:hypothetical protein
VTLEPETEVEKPLPPRRRGRQPGVPQPGRNYKTFKQLDLEAALRAVKKVGLENVRVSVDKSGTISVVPLAPGESAPDKGANEWDEVLRKDEDGG